MTPTTAQLQAHARELATAFNVRLIESAQLRPDEALGLAFWRVALCTTIVDETTYAVALHEVGHLAAPSGVLRGLVDGDHANLMRDEEAAAWAWARHYALVWTPLMDRVARWAESTYHATGRPVAPSAPAAPKQIDWKDWK